MIVAGNGRMNFMHHNFISLAEYAKLNGIEHNTARKRAARGAYKTVVKIGHHWVIDKNEPHVDHRITSGEYVGMERKQKSKQ